MASAGRPSWGMAFILNGLGECGANVAAERVVAGKSFVSSLEDDDVLLALERGNDGRFREGANDIDVNGTDRCPARLAKVIDCGFDVLSGRAERDEDSVGVCSFVFGYQSVIAAGQLAEIFVRVFKETQDRLGKVVAARDHALHVVLLILHGPKQDGVGEVDHLGHAAARRSEENALRLGGAVDHIVGRAEVLANQLGLVLVEGALKVGGQKAVHDVHARGERKLGDSAKDEGLVGGLLRVFAEDHDPAGVERAIDVVVAAVDVERVLGERARAHFKHHGARLAGRVVILLDAVDDALAGGEVDHALAADRVGNGSALGRVLAFSLNGDGVLAEDVQVAFGIGLLEELATLR